MSAASKLEQIMAARWKPSWRDNNGLQIRLGRFVVRIEKLPRSWRSRWGVNWLA